MAACSRSGGGCCMPASSRRWRRLRRGPGGRAGRTPGAPCPAGRGVGQGPGLLPAGRGERHDRVGLPRGGGRTSSRRSGPRASAGVTRHARAGHRSPARACARRSLPSGRAWAASSTMLREAEALAEALDDPRCGWDGCWPIWPCTSAVMGDMTAPSPRASVPWPSPSRCGDVVLQARRHSAWVRSTMPSATIGGRSSCCGRTWRRSTGSCATSASGTPILPGVSLPGHGWPACHAELGAFAEGRAMGRRRSGSPRRPSIPAA